MLEAMNREPPLATVISRQKMETCRLCGWPAWGIWRSLLDWE